jgi:signal transduction histidine kinase
MIANRGNHSPLNPLLELKACFWRGSVRPLRASVDLPFPDELAEFQAKHTDWFEGVYPTDLAHVSQAALQAAKGMAGGPLEYRMVTEKRGIVWVRHWLTASATRKGELEGFVQVSDERKQLEAECLRASEREKSAMGQELHDDVCQLLAGVACMVEVIGQKAKTAMPETVETLTDLSAQLHAGMDRARSLSHSLVPLRLVNLGLAQALRELANQAQKNFNIEVDVAIPKKNSSAGCRTHIALVPRCPRGDQQRRQTWEGNSRGDPF